MPNESIFNRQEQIFGKHGQDKIAKSRAVICGVGGIGSHVAQQLAYLGIGKLLLIDPDKSEESNMNRLIGGSKLDIGKAKVQIMEEMVERINSSISVSTIQKSIESFSSDSPFNDFDILIGCVDNDLARLKLIELSSKQMLPYFDLATEIFPKDGVLGGHIFLSNGNGCMLCANELNQEEIRKASASHSEKQFEKSVYGVSISSLSNSGPAVVSLNGLIASFAITEILMHLTEFSRPIQFMKLLRRSNFGRWSIEIPELTKKPNCYFCSRYHSEQTVN